MQLARDEFLAGAGLAGDQHGEVARRRAQHLLDLCAHRAAEHTAQRLRGRRFGPRARGRRPAPPACHERHGRFRERGERVQAGPPRAARGPDLQLVPAFPVGPDRPRVGRPFGRRPGAPKHAVGHDAIVLVVDDVPDGVDLDRPLEQGRQLGGQHGRVSCTGEDVAERVERREGCRTLCRPPFGRDGGGRRVGRLQPPAILEERVPLLGGTGRQHQPARAVGVDVPCGRVAAGPREVGPHALALQHDGERERRIVRRRRRRSVRWRCRGRRGGCARRPRARRTARCRACPRGPAPQPWRRWRWRPRHRSPARASALACASPAWRG